jgi:hypothetical protein
MSKLRKAHVLYFSSWILNDSTGPVDVSLSRSEIDNASAPLLQLFDF